jgi:hypothetical protein
MSKVDPTKKTKVKTEFFLNESGNVLISMSSPIITNDKSLNQFENYLVD